LVIQYTGTGTNNPSNSIQVSTSKLKSTLDKFTVSGLGLVYESTVLKHYQYFTAPKLFNYFMPRLNRKCSSGASKR